jgi:hypothetical protein
VLDRPYIKLNTAGGAECIGLQRQIQKPSFDSCSLTYGCLLLQSKNRDRPELDAYFLVNSVEINLVNNEVLTVIGSGGTSEGGFGSTGRLHEVGINNLDCGTCNDLYDGDIVDFIMLCVDGGEDRS